METLADDARVDGCGPRAFRSSLIGRTATPPDLNFVDLDFGAAVERASTHLAELGHRCVALFNFPPDQLAAGYTSALLAQQSLEKPLRGARDPRHPPQLPASGKGGLRGRGGPAAIRAVVHRGDHDGLAVQRPAGALRLAGLHVPDDFSVVSVISSQYAEMLTPALTSVEWPAFEAGRLAAQMLIERIGDDRAPVRQLLIGGDLVVRESTAPPPAPR